MSGNIASGVAVFADDFDKPAAVLDNVTMAYVGVVIVSALIGTIVLAIKRDHLGCFLMTSYADLSLLVGLAFGYTQTYIRLLLSTWGTILGFAPSLEVNR